MNIGLEFVPIYLEHPDVEKVYLVDTDASLLHVAQNRYGIPEENCTCEIQEVLDDPDIDAVHLVTPPATHAPLSIRLVEIAKALNKKAKLIILDEPTASLTEIEVGILMGILKELKKMSILR